MKAGMAIVLFTVSLFLLLPEGVKGQYGDTERKWALRYSGDVMCKPLLTSNPSKVSTGRGGSGFRLQGELYLPKKWTLEAGYFYKDLSYGDASRLMEGLQLGGKKYFLPSGLFVQPYLAGGIQLNWGERVVHQDFTYAEYARWQHSVNPRISFVPGAGVELYLFSSVAFVIEYDLYMGIGSSTELTVSPVHGTPYTIKDNGMHHSLALGVKATFPFSFTSEDGENLIYLITDLIVNTFDRYLEDNMRYR